MSLLTIGTLLVFSLGAEYTITLLLAAAFLLIVLRVFSPDMSLRYTEESLIPLEDDTEEEKQIFEQPARYPYRGRLDA